MSNSNRFWPSSSSEFLVYEPQSLEDMPRIVQALRENKSVLLNLSGMDASEAQRAVDFVSGATLMLNGHQGKVGKNIFLFTSNSVQVSTNLEQSNGTSHTLESQSEIPSNGFVSPQRSHLVAV